METAEIDRACEADIGFVLALGGFALRISGGTLVVHEKIPAPYLNYILVGAIGPERQTAFVERALDHYFQRAIRPTFRVPAPTPPFLRSALLRLGFRERNVPLDLMLEASQPSNGDSAAGDVSPANSDELDTLAELWTQPQERPEFRTAVDVAWHHPNPDEELLPLICRNASGVLGGALLYRRGSACGVYLVSTQVDARSQGVASRLVRYAVSRRPFSEPVRFGIWADSDRLRRHLETLGFRAARKFEVYELAAGAELAIPKPGPPTPPRWRPSRGSER